MKIKIAGITLAVAGAVLILLALLFAAYNEYVDYRAGTASERILEEFRRMLDGGQVSAPPQAGILPDTEQSEADSTEWTPEYTAPTKITVQGYDCIGYIEIPAIDLALPVLSDWSYEKLDVAPCRHFGSVYTEDLVISGHNYKRHFSYLTRLKPGDSVSFFDAAGIAHLYTVKKVTYTDESNVDGVKNSGYPLVLYTCTFYGDLRNVVFCEYAAGEN